MSMRSYFVNGYGFSTEDVTMLNVIKFIFNHAKTLSELIGESEDTIKTEFDKIDFEQLEEQASNSDTDIIMDILEDDKKYEKIINYLSGRHQFLRLFVLNNVASIIEKETNLHLSYEEGQSEYCIGTECIIFEEQLPWVYTEYEKSLSVDVLSDILNKYARELGASDTAGRKEVEYYG